MNWFNPHSVIIPDLSVACMESVFLVYLLRLKDKSKDCWLVILIYTSALLLRIAWCLIDMFTVISPVLLLINFFMGWLLMVTIIWCSHHIHRSIFPKECLTVISFYTLLYAINVCFWWDAFSHHRQAVLASLLFTNAMNGCTTFLGMINYLRKLSHHL